MGSCPVNQMHSLIAQTGGEPPKLTPLNASNQHAPADCVQAEDEQRGRAPAVVSHFDALPPELLHIIVSALAELPQTLKAFRGVSKTCEVAGTRFLFRRVKFRIDKEKLAHLHCILGSPGLRSVVTCIDINTAEYTDRNMNTFDWDDRDEEILRIFNNSLTMIGRFRNLRSVYFKFSSSCVGPPLRRHWWASQVPESVGFRMETLQCLFKGLNDPDNPLLRLNSLGIENLQDWVDEKFVESDTFRAVMAKISRLELQIATEEDETSPMSFIEKKELHHFFGTQLPQNWLAPCASKLTHLKLYAGRTYWGYIPKCILPHLPHLKSLILGKMTFTHDAQLAWILSHSATLEHLVLDDCPILVGAAWFGALDSDGYPTDTTKAISANSPSTHFYAARWHNYFREFRLQLPNLRGLRCGFDDSDWENEVAFSRSHTLEPRLWPERYRVFDTCWLERPPFASLNPRGDLEAGGYDGDWAGVPFYSSDCTDEDVTELVKLREVLNERAGVVDDDLIALKKMLF